MLIAVPCKDPEAVADNGLWSILSIAAIVYNPLCNDGGQTIFSSLNCSH